MTITSLNKNLRPLGNLEGVSQEIRQMVDLISPMGFAMMGARKIQIDPNQYLITWLMGSGAKYSQIDWYYRPSTDTYTLLFIRKRNQIRQYKQVDLVYVEDVIPLIEKYTGFYIRF